MGNVTEAAAPRPAWLSGRIWLIAAEAETGAIWYFEALDSDFTARPYRVLLRTDESSDPASPHDNSERLAEIDCAGHRYRILRTTHYDDAGRATEANERGDGRMVPVPPGRSSRRSRRRSAAMRGTRAKRSPPTGCEARPFDAASGSGPDFGAMRTWKLRKLAVRHRNPSRTR